MKIAIVPTVVEASRAGILTEGCPLVCFAAPACDSYVVALCNALNRSTHAGVLRRPESAVRL